MILRLLKNDINHGRMTNFIMMIFIAISTLLACSSISLMYSSANQITYFMNDMGNVADLNFTMKNIDEEDKIQIKTFLKDQGVEDYELEEDIVLPSSGIIVNHTDEVYHTGCCATTMPKIYNLIFDENNEIPVIQEGNIGIPLSMKSQFNLSIGDSLTIKYGSYQKTYIIQSFVRDSLFGSEMIGQKRIIFHPADYEEQLLHTSQEEHAVMLSIHSLVGKEQLEQQMQEAGLPSYLLISKDSAQLSFLGVGMGASAIMMMSGVILMCMSFLIIRFTILFQIEHNYAEIGIMKAIGFQHAQIKPLYLVKYMSITLLGSLIGFLTSIPFSNFMKQIQAGVVPVMPGQTGTYLSFLFVILILATVYATTTLVLRKIKKQSTMDAIRKGNEGESYQHVSKLQLAKPTRLSMHLFLALTDITAHVRNTIMVICIYGFCLLLMLVPLILKDSFQGSTFLQIVKITEGDLYTRADSGIAMDKLKEKESEVQQDLQVYDPDVSVKFEAATSASLSQNGVTSSVILTKRADHNENVIFDSGIAPHESNELALSSTLAKQYNKTIGDSIELTYDGKKETFLITGIYTSIMNLGNNMLAGDKLNFEYAYTNYLVIQFSGNQTHKQQLTEQVKEDYQKTQLMSAKDMMISLSGDVGSQIGAISDFMTIVILIITAALTMLFSKMQMIKAKKEIALLQSLGFLQRDIRKWQMRRCMIQAALAVVVGLIIHVMCSQKLLEAFFMLTGMGKIQLYNDVVHTYLVYPILFILCIWIAQQLANFTILKWNVQYMSEE